MYLNKRHEELISFFLRELYPILYSEAELQEVVTRINQCWSLEALDTVLPSRELLLEDAIWRAYYGKRKTLLPAGKRYTPLQSKRVWPLPDWWRQMNLELIRILLPLEFKRQPISLELQAQIEACQCYKDLSTLVHSIRLAKVKELDTIERRYLELP